MKLLEISAEDAERWERKKKKKNPDPGFAGELLRNSSTIRTSLCLISASVKSEQSYPLSVDVDVYTYEKPGNSEKRLCPARAPECACVRVNKNTN